MSLESTLDPLAATRAKQTDMAFEKIDANVDSFHHVQKVTLEDEGLPRMIEHPRRRLQLLEVFQIRVNIVRELQ